MSTAPPSLQVHPDRLLPPEPHLRPIARRLYDAVRHLPIISPHGHVDAGVLAEDQPFHDPASLLVSPDHYVTRLLHAQGVPLAELGVGAGRLDEAEARRAWRHLCSHWSDFRGTPVRYWLQCQLHDMFGVTLRPSAATADEIYDVVDLRLREDAFRPRALYREFGIDVLATTDDPVADLGAHAALRADPQWSGRVIPTFRPDRHLEPALPGWGRAVKELGEAARIDTGDYAGYLAALEARRAHFIEQGATSADHSHLDVRAEPLEVREAARIYAASLGGTATPAEAVAFRRHMLMEMARMSVEDGLVMTLHPAVRRNHHAPTSARFGGDTGHDIPVRAEFTRALQPLLERYGTHPNLRLVLLHHGRGGLLPRAGAPGRVLPLGVRRRAVVVPGRARRDPPRPLGGHRDGRVPQDVGVHRRHAGVLLHPGAARHVPSPRQRLARAARRGPPPRGGRGARDDHGVVTVTPRRAFRL